MQIRPWLARRRRHPLNACFDLSSLSSTSLSSSTSSLLLSSIDSANASRTSLSFVHWHLTHVACLGHRILLTALLSTQLDLARLFSQVFHLDNRAVTLSYLLQAIVHPSVHPIIVPGDCIAYTNFCNSITFRHQSVVRLGHIWLLPSASDAVLPVPSHVLNTRVALLLGCASSLHQQSGRSVLSVAICSGSAPKPFTRCIAFLLSINIPTLASEP